MPTDNYEDSANSYWLKFQAQSRSNDSAALTANEQQDRDNLLHFIEDNFKTGVKGGVKVEDLRAFLHLLVKSAHIQADDQNSRVLFSRGGRLSTTSATRHYYGSSTYGWTYTSWSSYATTVTNLYGSSANNAFVMPYSVKKIQAKGTIKKTAGSGDVTIRVYQSDGDDGSNTYVQNQELIMEKTIDVAVANDVYEFTIDPAPADRDNTILTGRYIWVVVTNDGWTSGTEYLAMSIEISGQELSTNWTSS